MPTLKDVSGIHRRHGGAAASYGSVAVAGPWNRKQALYEFYVQPHLRTRVFDLFAALLEACQVKAIETQTNARLLAVMLHTFCTKVSAEAILFEDRLQTSLHPEGAVFRAATAEDRPAMRQAGLDEGAGWVATSNGEIAGAGGVLYHYSRPYGDIYIGTARKTECAGRLPELR